MAVFAQTNIKNYKGAIEVNEVVTCVGNSSLSVGGETTLTVDVGNLVPKGIAVHYGDWENEGYEGYGVAFLGDDGKLDKVISYGICSYGSRESREKLFTRFDESSNSTTRDCCSIEPSFSDGVLTVTVNSRDDDITSSTYSREENISFYIF